MDESQPGIGNELRLADEDIEQNLRKVQLQNGLEPLEWNAKLDGRDFTVEMETGTGKTYVYLRTIFELQIMALPNLSLSCPRLRLRRIRAAN